MKRLSEKAFDIMVAAIPDGKRAAFAAVRGARLGLAVEDEPGYSPVPDYWFEADTRDEVEDEAERLNAKLDLSESESLKIIASTMKGLN